MNILSSVGKTHILTSPLKATKFSSPPRIHIVWLQSQSNIFLMSVGNPFCSFSLMITPVPYLIFSVTHLMHFLSYMEF